MIPAILRNFNLFINGKTYAGLTEEIQLPKLALKTEEHQAGGMDAPVELDMGMEKLEMQFTLSEFVPEVLALFGLADGNAVRLTFRGALEEDNGHVKSLVVNCRGLFKELEPSNIKASEKTTLKGMIACRYYKLTMDGKDIHEIDVVNMVRKINGKDQLKDIRDAIAL